MQQRLERSETPAEAGPYTAAGTTSPARHAAEPSPGHALAEARGEDRQWRDRRRKRLSHWIRRVARWGLISEAAARIGLFTGFLFGLLTLPAVLALAPLGQLLAYLAGLLLALAGLLYGFAWIVYVGLGLLCRWAKHEAILDDLPTRRPLFWPGAPRRK